MGGSLRDRLALITGASAGIGRSTVLAAIREGARVIGLARNGEALDELAAEIGDPDRFTARVADVSDAAAISRAISELRLEHGLPDVIVANAGVGMDALFVESSDDDLRAVFEVNVFGVVRTVRPFVAPMVERGSGRILIISSIVGKRGMPHYSAYAGSKFALHGMADALRSELLGTGVTVGLVCPGSTETEFRRHALKRGPEQPTHRPRRHSAESVAEAIVRMAASRRREVVIGIENKLLVLADRIAPGLVDRFMARFFMRR